MELKYKNKLYDFRDYSDAKGLSVRIMNGLCNSRDGLPELVENEIFDVDYYLNHPSKCASMMMRLPNFGKRCLHELVRAVNTLAGYNPLSELNNLKRDYCDSVKEQTGQQEFWLYQIQKKECELIKGGISCNITV